MFFSSFPQWELYFSNLIGLIPPHSITLSIIHLLLLSFDSFFCYSFDYASFYFFLSPTSYLLLCKHFNTLRFFFWKSLLLNSFIAIVHFFFPSLPSPHSLILSGFQESHISLSTNPLTSQSPSIWNPHSLK